MDKLQESVFEMKFELEQLLKKRDKINEETMRRFHEGSATRARTTTANASVGQLNERIDWLRKRIRDSRNSTWMP